MNFEFLLQLSIKLFKTEIDIVHGKKTFEEKWTAKNLALTWKGNLSKFR